MKKALLILGFIALLPTYTAQAGSSIPAITTTTIGSSGTDTVNRGYVGLKWTLGEGATPAVVVGFRHAKVDANGDTDGGDVSFSFNFVNGFQAGKLRTKYFNGQESVQGEVGAGYDFANGLFVGVGAKAPFSNVGVDYLFSTGSPWQPYFMLDTLKKYDKPNGSTTATVLTCPNDYTLNNTTGNCDENLD